MGNAEPNYSLIENNYNEVMFPVGNRSIVLLGKPGDGKSSTGNSIIGRKVFEVDDGPNSVTEFSCTATTIHNNRDIDVMDTPGFVSESKEEVFKEIRRMVFLLKDGVSAFIFVYNGTEVRISKEKQAVVMEIKANFQDHFENYCMLVYTRADAVLDGRTLNEFLDSQKSNEDMKTLLDPFGPRVVAVNNTAEGDEEKERNREVIIAMVDRMVQNNKMHGRPEMYTDQKFQKARDVHEQVLEIRREENIHAALVESAAEAFYDLPYIHRIGKSEFSKRVIEVLKKTERASMNERNNYMEFKVEPLNKLSPATYDEHMSLIFKELTKKTKILLGVIGSTTIATLFAATALGIFIALVPK